MVEEEVNYASVVLKSNKQPRSEVKEEETVYDEVKVQNKATEQPPDTNVKKVEETVYEEVKVENKAAEEAPDTDEFLTEKKSDSRCRRYQHLACCLATLCIILMLGIIAFVTFIHKNEVTELNQITQMAVNQNLTNLNNKLSSENEDLKRNRTELTHHIQNLTNLNNKLNSENEDLRSNQTELRLQSHNLTQASTVLEKQVTNLTEENQNLREKNGELETEKKNLTEQLQHMKTSWNELNVSQAQWSIDAYCPKQSNNRRCQPCQNGWLTFQSSCYAINNPDKPDDQKTWEEAQENCRGKSSDLAVVINAVEKKYVSDSSWGSSGNKGYWIGLRAVKGKWKWVDGSDMTDNSWIQQPPSDGLCAISVNTEGFKSVSCGEKNRWICKKKALSV